MEGYQSDFTRLVCTNGSLFFSRGDVAMNEWRAGMTCLTAAVRVDREKDGVVWNGWRWVPDTRVADFVNSLRPHWLYLWALNTVRCLRAVFL